MKTIKALSRLFDKQLFKTVLIAGTIGTIWFLVDLSFVYVLQFFLVVIGATEKSKTFLPDWLDPNLKLAVFSLLAFGLLRGLVQMARSYQSNSLGHKFILKYRSRLAQYALISGENESTADILLIFNEVIVQCSQAIIKFAELMISIIVVSCLLIAAAYMAPKELAVAFGILIVAVTPLKLLNGKINRAGAGLVGNWQIANSTLIVSMRNLFLIKVYNITGSQIDKILNALKSYEKNYRDYYKILSLKQSYPQFMGISIISLITLISVVYFGTPGITLLAFYFLFIRLAQATSDCQVLLSDLRLHTHAVEQMIIWEEKFAKTIQKSSTPQERINSPITSINLQRLTVGRNNSALTHALDLNLESGDKLLITGPSGSGKSTILATVLGLLPPVSGKILFNSQIELNENNSTDFLQSVSYVGPEPYLLPGTVRENLFFGATESSQDDEIWSALELCKIKKDIKKLPEGLDTVLTEHTQLSTGQKQRLSFARAVLRKPTLLILDEATANLDTMTESDLVTNIFAHLRQSIVIMVSHRNSFDDHFTHKITLDNAK